MPDISTLVVFASACLVLTATPGPDMLLIASRSVSNGRAAGFVTLAGIQAGTFVHAAAAAAGLTQLIAYVPLAYDVIRWAGAAYLLYLAWVTFRSAGTPPPQTETAAPISLWPIFRQGLVTNLLNPKMALFVLALFPQFLRPDAGSIALQFMVLAAVLNLMGLVVNGVIIFAASNLRDFGAGLGRFAPVPDYVLSTVFAGLALRLAIADRR